MKTISISDFLAIDERFPNVRFFRTQERTCSTRYLILDKKGKKMMIDCGDGKDRLDFDPDVVFLTHGHFDHASGVDESWKEVWIHPAEDPSLPFIKIPKNARKIIGQHFSFAEFHFNILHTPGHTPGSICIFEEKTKFLFSGDTKFANGIIGRTDLGGDGAEESMKQSLGMLEQVPYEILCPGHGEIERKDGRLI